MLKAENVTLGTASFNVPIACSSHPSGAFCLNDGGVQFYFNNDKDARCAFGWASIDCEMVNEDGRKLRMHEREALIGYTYDQILEWKNQRFNGGAYLMMDKEI